MPTLRERLRRQRWADVVVIVSAVYLLLAAAWAPLELVSGGGGWEVENPLWLMATYAIAGSLGLAGLFLTTRATSLGRIVIAAAGVLALSGLGSLERITLLAMFSLGIPGLALLMASVFAGQMPTPEQEGKVRTGLGE